MASKDRRTPREAQIAAEIADLERVLALAESIGKTADAVRAVQHLGSLRKEALRIAELRKAEACRDPIDRLRRLAKVSAEADSWTAAQKYHRSAAELELRRLADQRTAEVENLDGADTAALVDVLGTHITSCARPVVASLALTCLRALGYETVTVRELEAEAASV